jgi:hypothetical protein
MIITHTGTERNAILNLDYSIHSKKGFFPALMGNEVLAETEPVNDLTVKIRIPNTIKLSYKTLNTDEAPVISNEGLYSVYTWTLKNIPAISTEEFQPSNYDNYPRLIFSSENDRSSLFAGFIKQSAFTYGCDDEMKKSVQELMATSKEKTDILLKLQEKVVNEFKMWPIPLKYTGFTCRTATETWHSNGGTQIEKAILLTALLKEAGITAMPVAVVRNRMFDEKIASLLDIDEFIVKAELKEPGMVYLSVSSLNPQDLKYTYPDRTLVELNPTDKSKFIKSENFTNKISSIFTLKVDSGKQLSGDISLTMTNGSNPWLQLMKDKGKDKTVFTGGIVASDLKDPRIVSSDAKESLIHYTVQKNKAFRKDSNFSFFTLPVATKGIESWGIRLLPKNRITSIEIPSELEESYEYTFAIPPGMKSFSPEQKVEINNTTGSFRYELKTDKDKVTVSKIIKLKKRSIPASEYADFKALMDSWNNDRYREIIFEE